MPDLETDKIIYSNMWIKLWISIHSSTADHVWSMGWKNHR